MSTLTLRTCPICVALAAILFIFPAAVSAQNTISVPGDQATIQSAINVANNGDTVLVAPGTYTENINFNGKAITVTSSAGAAVTIIDGGRIGTVVTFGSAEGPGSVLKGFTIQNGQEYFGAGVTLLGGAPKIVGNVFINNTQLAGGFGAAIGGNSSSPNIEQNIFKGNSCDTQFDSGVVSFVNSSSPLVANNIFLSNPCRAINMGLPQQGAPKVLNNTIVGNSVGVHVDARVPTLGQIYKNNIVVNNTVGLEVDFGSAPNNPTWTNNLVFGNGTDYSGIANPTGSLGNISVDPLFVNVANSDYRLQSNSPAIDVGDNTALQLPQTDYVSNPRIVDANNDCVSAVDIGAYEFLRTANASLSTNALIFAGQPIGTSSNAQTVTLSNTGATCFQLSSIGITGDFSQGTNCAAAGVPAGSSCAFSVTFTPTAIGSRLGALTVSGSDGASPKTLNVSLSGTGSSPEPIAVLSPSTLTFAPQVVGTSSAAQAVTLSNQGSAALTISGINVTAPFSQTNNCSSSLAASGTCVISVVFRPTSLGSQLGSLVIADNASGSPHTASLSGTGIDFSITASPSSVTVKHAQSVKITVGVNPLGGAFNPSVALSCSGLPTGATCGFSPSSVVPGGNSASSALTLNTSGKTPRGTFNVLIVGTSGVTQHSTTVQLTVN